MSSSIDDVDEEDMGGRTEGVEAEVEDEEDMFLPFKLIQWEDDIIYDPPLSNSKVIASARQNAVYAGWIPSQVCRTMASFQVCSWLSEVFRMREISNSLLRH